jgi:monofunctional biosynthetic peptidoglycan transglycosylase
VLTIRIEKLLTKKRILELYLNVAEWGPGIFGAEAAANYYFGKSAKDLSPWESALLAAVLPQPLKYSLSNPSPMFREEPAKSYT